MQVTQRARTARRFSPLALAISIALLTPALAQAADGRSAAEIQAEIDRLTAELEAHKAALAQAGSAPAGA